jgi:probable HAF family extracellular repeat protein
MQWFDLGTLGGDRTDMKVMCMGVADTGMIVGHAAIKVGDIVHAFAWTPKSGMTDIGTLANLGYSGYSWSLAYGVNKAGTLIVGWSGDGWFAEDTLPVVWTPKVVWTSGVPTTTWNIQKLDTKGFEQASYWYATSVNDFGQIIGTATNSDGVEIAVLWNPVPGRNEWKIMQLPVSSDYPNAWPDNINDKGEIVGAVASSDGSTALPALWQKKSPSENIWNLTLLATPPGSPYSEAMGINDRGDIVGYSYDANWNTFAAQWSAKDPAFVRLLGFPGAGSPGAWSWAFKVNDNRIAVEAYGSDTILENVAAVQFSPE